MNKGAVLGRRKCKNRAENQGAYGSNSAVADAS